MSTRASRDVEEIIDLVSQTPGWRFTKTNNGYMIYPPDGRTPVAASKSKDFHAARNTASMLRRAGFVFPEDRAVAAKDDKVVTASGGPFRLAETQPVDDPIERIEKKMGQVIELFASIETDLKQVRESQAALHDLRKILGRIY